VSPALEFGVAALVGLASLWPLRRLALRLGLLDRPGARKAQPAPVPYLGGVAVVLALAAGAWWEPSARPLLFVVGAVCALGLADDARNVSVPIKLGVELAAAAAAVLLGYGLHAPGAAFPAAVFSVIWIVGLTNSVNMLDNMDGLSSTVAAVALLGLAAAVPAAAPIAVALAAGLAAFLVVNAPPARMYLGDAGALPVGFAVGVVSLIAAGHLPGRDAPIVLLAPVAVTLFDTALVITDRLLHGRPVERGGRDHFSHRLLAMGWSRPRILAAAATTTALGAAAAVIVARWPWVAAGIAGTEVLLLIAGWWWLLGIEVYNPALVRSGEAHNA